MFTLISRIKGAELYNRSSRRKLAREKKGYSKNNDTKWSLEEGFEKELTIRDNRQKKGGKKELTKKIKLLIYFSIIGVYLETNNVPNRAT